LAIVEPSRSLSVRERRGSRIFPWHCRQTLADSLQRQRAGPDYPQNDDAHPPARGSLIIFTAPTSGNYVFNAGCFSNTSCSGTVASTIQ
jgi:hypothetical protein